MDRGVEVGYGFEGCVIELRMQIGSGTGCMECVIDVLWACPRRRMGSRKQLRERAVGVIEQA